jgi:transposase
MHDPALQARALKMCADGATSAEVAEKLEISISTIANWRAKANKRAADAATVRRKSGPPPSTDMAKAARAYAMREKGTPIAKVAAKYGVSTATIYEWCKRVRTANGLPPARAANGHAKDTARRAAVGLDNGHAPGPSPADALLAARSDVLLAPRTIVGAGDLQRQVRALTIERDALRRIVDELSK